MKTHLTPTVASAIIAAASTAHAAPIPALTSPTVLERGFQPQTVFVTAEPAFVGKLVPRSPGMFDIGRTGSTLGPTMDVLSKVNANAGLKNYGKATDEVQEDIVSLPLAKATHHAASGIPLEAHGWHLKRPAKPELRLEDLQNTIVPVRGIRRRVPLPDEPLDDLEAHSHNLKSRTGSSSTPEEDVKGQAKPLSELEMVDVQNFKKVPTDKAPQPTTGNPPMHLNLKNAIGLSDLPGPTSPHGVLGKLENPVGWPDVARLDAKARARVLFNMGENLPGYELWIFGSNGKRAAKTVTSAQELQRLMEQHYTAKWLPAQTKPVRHEARKLTLKPAAVHPLSTPSPTSSQAASEA